MQVLVIMALSKRGLHVLHRLSWKKDVFKFNRCNNKCKYESGYISGDIKLDSTKQAVFNEIKKWDKQDTCLNNSLQKFITMTDLQEQVKDVCRLADAVIKDPATGIAITAVNIGVCTAVAVFAAGGGLILAPLFGPWGWAIAAGTWIAKKLGEKEKQRQEKERMLREVIRKQQAVIKKLDQELAKSRQQNAQNRQEINNLKEILRMLEETEEHLNAA